MKKPFLNLSIAAFSIAMLASCQSTTAPLQSNLISLSVRNTISIPAGDRALFVLNEGAFGKTNSSLDVIVFHASGSTVDTIVHTSELSGMGLGNDILFNGDEVVMLDNGSNLVDVGSVSPLKSMTGIPIGLDAPNKMALLGANQLLVTRRNATSAVIVNLTTNTIADSIPLGGASIAVAVLNNKAYITTAATEYAGPFHLNIVDLSTLRIVKTIPLAESPEQAVADSANGEIIIAMGADYANKIPPQLYFVNTTTDIVADSLTAGTYNDDPEITTGSKHFIVMGMNVYPLSGPTHQMPAPIIQGATAYYKGMYDAATNALYLGNARDYTNPGNMDVYNASTGKLLWSHIAGIIPGHFAFYH